ncbi:MAG: hypothetical protein IKE43_03645 [Coriobacteriales bacterium]|nr:hypothetical protein [Coriobacteriales bacterium]
MLLAFREKLISHWAVSFTTIAIQASISAIFFSYIAVEYAWPKSFTLLSDNSGLRIFVFVSGIISGIVFAGTQHKENALCRLFKLGCIAIALSTVLSILSRITDLSIFSYSHTFVSTTGLTILILAWCEFTSTIRHDKRALFLIVNCFDILLFTTLLLLVNAQLAIIVLELLIVFSTMLQLKLMSAQNQDVSLQRGADNGNTLYNSKNKQNTTKSASLPAMLLIVLFMFGVIQTFLCPFSKFVAPPAEVFGILQILIWIVCILIAMMIMLTVCGRSSLRIIMAALPFVSFALLIPYFFMGENQEIRALVVLTVACESTICGAGLTNSIWRIQKSNKVVFVFWQRSVSSLGSMLGYCIATVIAKSNGLGIAEPAMMVLAIGYLVIASAVLVLVERSNEIAVESSAMASQLQQSDNIQAFDDACDAISKQYGLTNRESEILSLLARGRSLPWIQENLHISHGTAAAHVNHIYRKVGVNNRQDIINAVENAMLE